MTDDGKPELKGHSMNIKRHMEKYNRTNKSHSNEKVLHIEFSSAYEFYSAVQYAINNQDKYVSKPACDIISKRKNDSSFAGADWDTSEKRKYQWKEGLKRVQRLTQMESIVHSSQYVNVWNDYDGDVMDVDRYLNEQPFLSRRVKKSGKSICGQYRIVINIAENGTVSAQNMLWKAYAAARLCDEIESQGNRCEVVAVSFLRGQTCDTDYAGYTYTEVTIKKHEESVNTGLLCTCLSPWFFRTYMFMVWRHYLHVNNWLGWSSSLREYLGNDIDNTCILIDAGDCLSHEKANTFIKTIDIGNEFEL